MKVETALAIAKYTSNPLGCWPVPVGSSGSVIRWHYIRLYIALIHLPTAIAVSVYNIYLNRDDIVRILKILTESVAITSVFAKVIICQIEAHRIRVLVDKMETFLRHATSEDKELIQRCVDKYLVAHLILFANCIVGTVSFIVAPMVTEQLYPADVAYPFSVESTWVWLLVYISQSYSTLQVSCMIMLDVGLAILLWLVVVRFEILSLKFQRATTVDEVICCAREHQELLSYANQLKMTISLIAAEVSVFFIFEVGAGGLILMGNASFYEKMKYVCFEVGAAMELLVLTWPADNLIEVSEKLGHAALSCDWIGKSSEMVKNLLIVSQRSHNPIVLSVDGLLPVLSLEYYGSTILASLSYLTTLRAITAE